MAVPKTEAMRNRLVLVFLLPWVFLAGCQQSHQAKVDYATQVQTAVNATDRWLASPKDEALLDLAAKDCSAVMQDYTETDFDKTPSMHDLKLTKVALMLCKVALEQGVAPDVAPQGLTSQSPADSVREAKERVEADLEKELHPGATPTPAAPATP